MHSNDGIGPINCFSHGSHQRPRQDRLLRLTLWERKDQTTMRIALYARVSTQRQTQTQTIEQQLDRLQHHVHTSGWPLPL